MAATIAFNLVPTYVYKFVDSGETIEVQQSFTDDALTEAEHPVTGELLPVRKVFTPVGVTFKGSGFFKTDNRGKKSAASASSSSSSETGGGSGESSKSSGSSSGSNSGSSSGSGDSSKSSGSSSSGSSGSGSSSASSD